MNTLEQVLLLEQKVQSAVEKIKQLQAENDALRSKCAELTNAVSSKSEQLKSFESDKNLIQSGIQKALDHLNSIEYSVLDRDDQVLPIPQPVIENPNPVIQENIEQEEIVQEEQENISVEEVNEETESEETVNNDSFEVTENNTFQVNNPIELENKLEEDFNSSSPAKFEVPNFFGAPISYPLNDSFDTMKPVESDSETGNENNSPFGNDFGTDFDNNIQDEDNPDNEIGFDFC